MGAKVIQFKDNGLVPAVVQDDKTGDVLMVAYMNEEALRRTIASREAWFYSRSRQELWHKGDTSGSVLKVRAMWKDCDEDCILLRVDPAGPVCHTGNRSCFFEPLKADDMGVTSE
ncbi:MAG: phosphoribosyl-AMP cyclohydrolase [Chloroflexi bacterium]|nr:phosphoribosyl-AMP cyclohydrolase [Chloroflexota bacterium]